MVRPSYRSVKTVSNWSPDRPSVGQTARGRQKWWGRGRRRRRRRRRWQVFSRHAEILYLPRFLRNWKIETRGFRFEMILVGKAGVLRRGIDHPLHDGAQLSMRVGGSGPQVGGPGLPRPDLRDTTETPGLREHGSRSLGGPQWIPPVYHREHRSRDGPERTVICN